MRTKKEKRNRMWIALLAFCLLFGGVGGYLLVQATIDETNATHVDASEIEPSTMIVGTHLIYIESLSGELYEIAVESEQQASQYRRYYKSELADGTWFDITDASGLADISTSGIVVSEEEIEALLMTHHTKSDGITYDLVTGQTVCIFDISNPYDMENLAELNPIKVQYERFEGKPKSSLSETDKRNVEIIKELYGMDFSTEQTKEIERQMAALQAYYEILVRDEGDPAMSDMVLHIMEKLDATRRSIIFERLSENTLNAFLECLNLNRKYFDGYLAGYEAYLSGDISEEEFYALMGFAATEDSEEEDESKKEEEITGFMPDSILVEAVGEAQSNAESSYAECLGKLVTEGNTVLGKAEYEAIEALVEAAQNNDYASCDRRTKELIYLDNINNGVIADGEAEEEYISEVLLPMGDEAYKKILSGGVGEVYKTLPSTAAAATKVMALKNRKNDTEAVRAELQFLIQAKIDRVTAGEAADFLMFRLENVTEFESTVQKDAFSEYANESIRAYIQWLTKKNEDASKEMSGGITEELNAQKKALQEERKEALDHNDLKAASLLDAKIEAVDKALADEEKRLNAIINSVTATRSEKAAAAAALGAGSASAAVKELLDRVLNGILEGNYGELSEQLDGLGAMAAVSPDSVLNALQQIYDELIKKKLTDSASNDLIDALLTQVETVTADNNKYFRKDLSEGDMNNLVLGFFGTENGVSGMESLSGTGTGSEGGAGDSEEVGGMGSADDGSAAGVGLSGLAKALSGKSESECMAAIAGINMYIQETGATSLTELLRAYILREVSDGNARIYEKYQSNPTMEYVPLDLLARATKYRYIFNDSLKQVVLQKGASYYEFQVFYQTVKRQKGETEDMDTPAVFQKVLYIDTGYSEKTFSYTGMYLEGTEYGILLSEDERKEAEAFFAYLMETEGGY